MNRKRFLATALAFLMCGSLVTPAISAGTVEYQDSTEGTSCEVVYTQESNFEVIIPKKITLDTTKTSPYSVDVNGDFSGEEKVVVVPEADFLMSDVSGGTTKKADVTATVSQDKTQWLYNEVDTNGNGLVSAPDLTSGSWHGTFFFNIEMAETVHSFDENGFCINCNAFELQENNFDIVGISKEGDVVIPETFEYEGENYKVTSIGDYAFYRCSELTSITIPEGVTSIGNSVFSWCSGLTSITIPKGVTSIGNRAFGACESLTNITIPEGVTSISNDTFGYCESLTNITIPASVTSIGNRAFAYCTSLENIVYKGMSEPTISNDSFNDVPATIVHVPVNYTSSSFGALLVIMDQVII